MKSGRGELHRVLSAKSLRVLADAFGAGFELKVPLSTAHADHIALWIGAAETTTLVAEFGGTKVYIPGVAKRPRGQFGSDLEPSLAEVHRLTKAKTSARVIARKHGCSRRTIYNKRKRIRDLLAQGSSV